MKFFGTSLHVVLVILVLGCILDKASAGMCCSDPLLPKECEKCCNSETPSQCEITDGGGADQFNYNCAPGGCVNTCAKHNKKVPGRICFGNCQCINNDKNTFCESDRADGVRVCHFCMRSDPERHDVCASKFGEGYYCTTATYWYGKDYEYGRCKNEAYALDESCPDGADAQCEGNLKCNGSNKCVECTSDGHCGADKYCHGGVCKEKKFGGETCGRGAECKGGLCHYLVECGCDTHDDCKSGRYCETDSSYHEWWAYCLILKNAGDDCKHSYQCKSPATCSSRRVCEV